MVRNPRSEPALRLKSQGVVLFEGDNDNFTVFRQAATGCKGLYLNLQPSPSDPNAQQRQARGIVQACKEAGVETIVLSTAFLTGDSSKWDTSLGQSTGVRDYFIPKAEMEKVVREAGVKHYTILRPAWFHANYLLPYSAWHLPGLCTSGELWHSYEEGVKMSHIDEDDIAKYAVAALLDPSKFNGQEIELGNENLTIVEATQILRKVSGRQIRLRKRNAAEIEAAKTVVPTQTFQLWANRVDSSIDGQAVQKKFGIRMTSLEDYLVREKGRVLASLPQTETDFAGEKRSSVAGEATTTVSTVVEA